MTNRELIEHLSQFPPDAPVTIRMMSENCDLDAEEVKLIEMHKHNQVWMDSNSFKRYGGEGPAVKVVHFPGN